MIYIDNSSQVIEVYTDGNEYEFTQFYWDKSSRADEIRFIEAAPARIREFSASKYIRWTIDNHQDLSPSVLSQEHEHGVAFNIKGYETSFDNVITARPKVVDGILYLQVFVPWKDAERPHTLCYLAGTQDNIATLLNRSIRDIVAVLE